MEPLQAVRRKGGTAKATRGEIRNFNADEQREAAARYGEPSEIVALASDSSEWDDTLHRAIRTHGSIYLLTQSTHATRMGLFSGCSIPTKSRVSVCMSSLPAWPARIALYAPWTSMLSAATSYTRCTLAGHVVRARYCSRVEFLRSQP